jgi:hypothetical protein
VLITHPLHPNFGQRLPVWRGPIRTGKAQLIVVEMPNGARRGIPIDWTELSPRREAPLIQGRPVLFEAGRLLLVRQWADAAEKLTRSDHGSESPQTDSQDEARPADHRRSSDRRGGGQRAETQDRGTRRARRDRTLDGARDPEPPRRRSRR